MCMKNNIITLLLIFSSFFIAKIGISQEAELDTLPANYTCDLGPKDTLIVYDMSEQIRSSMGAEATVIYIENIISESKTVVFGEVGRLEVYYFFESDRIRVEEVHIAYRTNAFEVESEDDIRIEKTIQYYMDFEGFLIDEPTEEILDIFEEFENVVPFLIE